MDPQAALDAAYGAILRGDKGAARRYLEGYLSWRQGGGFQPRGGDKRYARLVAILKSL